MIAAALHRSEEASKAKAAASALAALDEAERANAAAVERNQAASRLISDLLPPVHKVRPWWNHPFGLPPSSNVDVAGLQIH